jgi:heme exporter protein D
MMLPTLLLLLHGDAPAMELAYFWAAVLLALTPVVILGGIGVWLARKMWRERQEEKVRNAEFGMRN